MKEIARRECRSYPFVLNAKERGEYVAVEITTGRDLTGRKYDSNVTGKWEGKDGRKTVRKYLDRNDSKVFRAILSAVPDAKSE